MRKQIIAMVIAGVITTLILRHIDKPRAAETDG